MLLFAAGADFGYCIFLAASEKFMDRGRIGCQCSCKTHVPGPLHIGKSDCRLENCRATASITLALPNRFCLTLYHVINYNDVTSYLSKYLLFTYLLIQHRV